jgi:alpha-glucosidase (family GH31 glycosyl hydrolase)
MNEIPAHLRPGVSPVARPEAIVRAQAARFTVLTPRLVRLEYSPHERFVDAASQVFWYREQPVPPFALEEDEQWLTLQTGTLQLRYRKGAPFSGDSLQIALLATDTIWHYGDEDNANLKGTTRTLDAVSGSTPLEPGLLSRNGWTVVDDSHSLLFNDRGWLESRPAGEALDLYFFAYPDPGGEGASYQQALDDYLLIAGRVPMIPRWALGNWWSRYWAYSQEELTTLMQEFRRQEVPLAVCIVDMDWHITDTGNASTGWTGYTWNRQLFPDPEGFIRWLHKQGLRTALNLHPAEGIHPHEAAYPDMARHMGIDPETETPVPFDLADPHFAAGYFRYLHHPLEELGVDFWWLDWQQGTLSSLPRLDPLWWLNHLHFHDRTRDGRRGFIFSRWGGLGNHRYPIGFSGDTFANWESLAFQPYLTATAANVAFGWWSHDIGGHMQGIEDGELYTRWVQFGVFSPIMRLHSTNNPYHERRPWGYDANTLQATRAALQLRHAFIPYLYTMAWRNSIEGRSLARPLYHDYPHLEEAYHCPDEYTFGSELLAAPYITPAAGETRLSRQVVWLPPGEWFAFEDGRRFPGSRWYAIYGDLNHIPLFARAGAIVPLGPRTGWGGVDNPGALDIYLFPGASNEFVLYEDGGSHEAHERGNFALTPMALSWEPGTVSFTLGPVQHDSRLIPARRAFTVHLRGVSRPGGVSLAVNGEPAPATFTFDEATATLSLPAVTLGPDDRLTLRVSGQSLHAGEDYRRETVRRIVEHFHLQTTAKSAILGRLGQILADPAALLPYGAALHPEHWRALLEVITGAGSQYIDHLDSAPELILWNNDERDDVRYRLAAMKRHLWSAEGIYSGEAGPLPRFRALVPGEAFPASKWELSLRYGELHQLQYAADPGRAEDAS